MHIFLPIVLILILTLIGGIVIVRFFTRTTLQFKRAQDGSDLFVFEKDGKYGFRDLNQHVIIPPKFEYAGPFSEGVSAVKLNDKYGYISPLGNLILGWFPGYCGDFSAGLAPFEKDGKAGYINTKGDLVIEPQWDIAKEFSENYAVVGRKDRFGLIDISGAVIAPLQFEELRPVLSGVAAARQKDLWGVIFPNGEWLYPPQFTFLGEFEYGKAIVRRKINGLEEEGVAALDGTLTWTDKLAAANEFARKLKLLKGETANLMTFFLEKGCPCQFPRFRRLVRFQGAAVHCLETETLIAESDKFLKEHPTNHPDPGDHVTLGYYTCKVCGTEWRKGRERFSGNKKAHFLLIEEDHVEIPLGASEAGIVPLFLGFEGPARQVPGFDGFEMSNLEKYLQFMRKMNV